jgi:hypothetical protein
MAQYRIDTNEYLSNGTTIFEAIMLADKDGNIINTFGAASNVPIAAGLVDGYSHINKFGYTGSDINGTCTIWDHNGTTAEYPYPAAGVVSVAGGNTNNDGDLVEVQGLDADYNLQTVNVAVGATTTETFSRVFRARMATTDNVTDISVSINGTVVAKILNGNGQTLMAVYTIPAGKTGYLMQFMGTMDKANAPVKYKIFARPFGNGFNLKGQFGSQGGNPVNYNYSVPLVFAEKTDIKINVDTSGAVGCGATFDLILVENS